MVLAVRRHVNVAGTGEAGQIACSAHISHEKEFVRAVRLTR